MENGCTINNINLDANVGAYIFIIVFISFLEQKQKYTKVNKSELNEYEYQNN